MYIIDGPLVYEPAVPRRQHQLRSERAAAGGVRDLRGSAASGQRQKTEHSWEKCSPIRRTANI